MNNKKNRIRETLTLSPCTDNSTVSKTKQNILVRFGKPLCLYGSMQGDPEQNGWTIHKSNPERLLSFKAPH